MGGFAKVDPAARSRESEAAKVIVPRDGRAVGFTRIALLVLFGAACTAVPVETPPIEVKAPLLASATTTVVSPTETPPPAEAASATPAPTPAVLIAVGDIARCDSAGDEATALLVESMEGVVATLGDNVYDSGTPDEFAECFDPSWGRLKDRLRPSVGNHEYYSPGATGYYDYFGAAAGEPGKGYYSYDLGAWHIVSLNSVCWEVGGCTKDDPQAKWLEADLRAHPALCTLAYWHFPRFSSGEHGYSDVVDSYWRILAEAGAEIVLTGHDHDYERFAPLDAEGREDLDFGVRQFVVGTGGASHYPFPGSPPPSSQVRDDRTFGVLVLNLHQDWYEWQFVPVPGGTFIDAGSGVCHP